MILIWCCLCFNQAAQAAPSVVDSSISCTHTGTTISTTVNSNTGSSLFILVAVGTRVAATVNSVSHNSDSMTLVSDTENTHGDTHLAVFKRTAPDAGAGLTVTADLGADQSVCIAAVVFQGVNQTTPVDGEAIYDPEANGLNSTLNVSSATGDLVVDFLFMGVSDSVDTQTITEGAGQTKIEDAYDLDNTRMVVSTESGAASVTMSWGDWADFNSVIGKGYNINVVAQTSPLTIISRRRRQ